MKPRRPRLGGIVDDYCSRERRITDHAVVAMVEDEIKQTRCTTCDDEHAYKGAKIPAARKKNSTLYQQVLAGKGDPDASARPSPSLATAARGNGRTAGAERAAAAASGDAETADRVDGGTGEGLPLASDEVRVHRQLIRATLPRPEGQVQARPLPEFTIRQSGSFDGQYENDARRPARGGRGHAGPPDGQPGNRRGGDGSKPRRPHRPPHGRGQSAAGNTADPPGGRPRSRSRRSRSSSRNRKRSK
jgi:hypothetical protein